LRMSNNYFEISYIVVDLNILYMYNKLKFQDGFLSPLNPNV